MIPTVKVQKISNDMKKIIEDIINKKYDKRLYEKRTLNEKKLIKRLVTALKLDELNKETKPFCTTEARAKHPQGSMNNF